MKYSGEEIDRFFSSFYFLYTHETYTNWYKTLSSNNSNNIYNKMNLVEL